MPNTAYILASLGTAAGVTWALRALPFTVVAMLRRSEAVRYLSENLPAGIMIILVVYSLRGLDLGAVDEIVPTLVSLNLTIALQLWRRNALLSIFGGAVSQVVLLSTVFG